MSTGFKVITCESASFAYRGRVVFPETSLEIRSGECVVLTGPDPEQRRLFCTLLAAGRVQSGAVRYYSPDGSRSSRFPSPYTLDRRDIAACWNETPAELRQAAHLPYQARWNSLYRVDSPTVASYLAETKCPEQAVEDLLAALGIGHLLNRPIMSLSKGEGRLTALAGVLLRNPRVLFCEDPCSALDSRHCRLVEELIRNESSRRTVMLSLSDPPSGRYPVQRRLSIAGFRVYEEPNRAPRKRLRLLVDTDQARTRSSRPVLQVIDASVEYGGVYLLKNIDWRICAGECWLLRGENGCGKSTLLALIAGDHLQVYTNKVLIEGRRYGDGDLFTLKRRVGFAAPELLARFSARLTCLELVMTGFTQTPSLLRASQEQRRAAEELIRQMAPEIESNDVFGGICRMKKLLLLICRAVVGGPAVVLLDEMNEGLTSGERARISEAMNWIADTMKIPLVIATHRPDEAPSCITHELVLFEGRVRSIGRIRERNQPVLLS